MAQEVVFEKFKVSKKLKLLAYITTAMGFLLFAYPVVFILSSIEGMGKYRISDILYYLEKIFFLTIPDLITSYAPENINAYIAYTLIYVLFAILLMIISNFLLEKNILAIAFSFVIFLSLSVSEYLYNHSLFEQLNLNLAFYFVFALVPLLLAITEIIKQKYYKKQQLYVKIITSVLIIAFIFLCFWGLIWLIQNKDQIKSKIGLLNRDYFLSMSSFDSIT